MESVIPRCQAASSTCKPLILERLNSSLDLNVVENRRGRRGDPNLRLYTEDEICKRDYAGPTLNRLIAVL